MGDEFDEYDIIERHAKQAAARRLEEARAANDVMQAQEKRDTAERRERAHQLSIASNEMIRMAEYDRYGVEPLPGPKVSIGLLFKLGYRIEEISGERRLIPPDPEKPRRKTR